MDLYQNVPGPRTGAS